MHETLTENASPETKAVLPHEASVTHAEVMRIFEAFKEANDQRLGEIERRSADVLSDDKVARINRALDEKMAAIYEYATSPLFSPAERVALDFAMEAASVPNAVTDESYAALAEHWSETQIVELLGVVCMFGVFNRWNDSMATPLEELPLARADELLGDHGWEAGKHARPAPQS